MPRKTNWRKSENRRVVLGQQEVSEGVNHRQNPASVQIQSSANEQALSSVSVQANRSKPQKYLEKGNKQNEFTSNVSQI